VGTSGAAGDGRAAELRARVEGYDPALFEGLDFDPDGVAFNTHVGIEWDLVSPDRVEAHLEVGPQHLMPYGNVHGGVLATLVEAVGSVAGAARVLADGRGAVGVHNSTDFLRPVTGGRLAVVATPIQVGRTQHLWLVEISDDRGRLVAHGQLRMQVVDRPDRPPVGGASA
jgi:1,4-dihydroxy-2-naphthoyl-CoA hydrolase